VTEAIQTVPTLQEVATDLLKDPGRARGCAAPAGYAPTQQVWLSQTRRVYR
jgi:hypothetical protein